MADLITLFQCEIALILAKSLAKLKIEVTFIDISIIETQMNRFLFTIDTDFVCRESWRFDNATIKPVKRMFVSDTHAQ